MRRIEVCGCDKQSNYECGGMMRSHCDYVQEYSVAEVALCSGRHPIPQAVDGAIFGDVIDDPTNTIKMMMQARRALLNLEVKYVDLYVTGLTVALVAVLNAARALDISVTLYHYNRETGEYYPQEVW